MSSPFFTTDNKPIPPQQTPPPPATIGVGSFVPTTDEKALFADQGGDFTGHTDYIIENHYERDGHRYMAGVSSPGGFQGSSVAFFQLAVPTLMWISRWTGCRWTKVPNVPDPDQPDKDWVLLDIQIVTRNVTVPSADGITPLYRISGVYVYGQRNPDPQVYNQVLFGRPPWMIDEPKRTVPLSSLSQNLINGDGGTGLGNPGDSGGPGLGTPLPTGPGYTGPLQNPIAR